MSRSSSTPATRCSAPDCGPASTSGTPSSTGRMRRAGVPLHRIGDRPQPGRVPRRCRRLDLVAARVNLGSPAPPRRAASWSSPRSLPARCWRPGGGGRRLAAAGLGGSAGRRGPAGPVVQHRRSRRTRPCARGPQRLGAGHPRGGHRHRRRRRVQQHGGDRRGADPPRRGEEGRHSLRRRSAEQRRHRRRRLPERRAHH